MLNSTAPLCKHLLTGLFKYTKFYVTSYLTSSSLHLSSPIYIKHVCKEVFSQDCSAPNSQLNKRNPIFVTPWTVTCQAPPSMRFPRQEYWMGTYSLLQGSFPTQGLNPDLLHCRWILNHRSHQRSPI